jgi:hypothetical protein
MFQFTAAPPRFQYLFNFEYIFVPFIDLLYLLFIQFSFYTFAAHILDLIRHRVRRIFVGNLEYFVGLIRHVTFPEHVFVFDDAHSISHVVRVLQGRYRGDRDV